MKIKLVIVLCFIYSFTLAQKNAIWLTTSFTQSNYSLTPVYQPRFKGLLLGIVAYIIKSIMKHIISILSIIFFTSSYAQTKFNYAISTNFNKSYYQNLNGVKDYSGFTLIKKPLGASIGGRLVYMSNKHIYVLIGIDYSIKRLKYFYHGVSNELRPSTYEFPILLQYNFQINSSRFFVFTGTVLTINEYSLSYTEYDGSIYRPQKKISYISNKGIFPLLTIGLGTTRVTKKNKNVDLFCNFVIGNKPMIAISLERFSPYLKSTFNYNGTHLDFGIRYYLKRNRNEN